MRSPVRASAGAATLVTNTAQAPGQYRLDRGEARFVVLQQEFSSAPLHRLAIVELMRSAQTSL